MSRWLSSVNNLLEKLDGQVENVAEDGKNVVSNVSARAMNIVQQATRRPPDSDIDSDEYYSDEELYSTAESAPMDDNVGESADEEDDVVYSIEDNQPNISKPAPTGDGVDGGTEQTQTLYLNERVPTNEPIIGSAKEEEKESTQQITTTEQTKTTPAEAAAESSSDTAQSPEGEKEIKKSDESKEDTKLPAKPKEDIKESEMVKESQSVKESSVAETVVKTPVSSSTTQQVQQQQQSAQKGSPKPVAPMSAPHERTAKSSIRQPGMSSQPSMSRQYQQQLNQLKKQHAAEIAKLEQTNNDLQDQLDRTNAELRAVNKELHDAADMVTNERKMAAEERDELLLEQEDEMKQMKKMHDEQIQELKNELKSQKQNYEAQLSEEAKQRMKQGGDMSAEIQGVLERERIALEQVKNLQQSNNDLQTQLSELQGEYDTLEEKFYSAQATADAARKAAATMEERLDEATENHQKQMQQRLAREAALEQTVAELSQTVAMSPSDQTDLNKEIMQKEQRIAQLEQQYKVAVEELETAKSEQTVANQRCLALQQELTDISKERDRETATTQAMIRDYDSKIHELTIANNRLKKNGNFAVRDTSQAVGTNNDNESPSSSDDKVQQLIQEVERSKKQISSLSDQLLRQQGITDTAKSEVMALKGRLQVALSRAELAEKQQQESSSFAEVELGGAQQQQQRVGGRRRIKGGRKRFGQLETRSIRHTVGLHRVSSYGSVTQRIGQHIGDTIDALDNWMLDTGNIFRHEPMARLGFLVYLTVIHLWCFGLVVFHTIEAEHGDLGQLTEHSRVGLLHRVKANGGVVNGN